MSRLRLATYITAALLVSCMPVACSDNSASGQATPGQESRQLPKSAETTDLYAPIADAEPAITSPHIEDILPEPMRTLWEPWYGDFDDIIQRRVIRVLVPFGGYQFYYYRGMPRGAIVELLQKMEQFVNRELHRRNIKVYVIPIPVSRDQLIPFLLRGHADLIAADLTVTEERSQQLLFSRPLLKGINEVLVTGPSSPPIGKLEDLSGQEVVVRVSSSYFEHLLSVSTRLEQQGLAPILITQADELLEAEDLLEMVNTGMIPATILDDYKAEFWATVFPELVVRKDISINDDGVIAWAMAPQNSNLAAFVERFLRKYGRGTLVGNDTFNRYLADADRIRCAMSPQHMNSQAELMHWFRMYGEQYGFDWLKLAAQGYQESHLKQNKRSAAGAVGIMQIKPSTAADRNVGIADITLPENNIHAGTKYMRFLSDRYFSDGVNELNRWLFSLAAYNAGPARVARLRREATETGLDRNHWFGQVEIIAAKRIGRETVTYVSSIYKYYIGYKLAEARLQEQSARHGADLTGCNEES